MNKFRRFLDRISAETCLKMDYFGSKFPKIANRFPCLRRLEASLPGSRSNEMTTEHAKTTLIEITG